MGFGEVWWSLMRFGEAWWGLVGFGEVWWGLVRFGGVWWGLLRFDGVWWGLVRFGEVWWGLMRFAEFDGVWWVSRSYPCTLHRWWLEISVFGHVRCLSLPGMGRKRRRNAGRKSTPSPPNGGLQTRPSQRHGWNGTNGTGRCSCQFLQHLRDRLQFRLLRRPRQAHGYNVRPVGQGAFQAAILWAATPTELLLPAIIALRGLADQLAKQAGLRWDAELSHLRRFAKRPSTVT